MRIDCDHGFFKFTELKPGQISRFQSFFKSKIVRQNDFYTFENLINAPTYSIIGNQYLGAVATKTFEGIPSEIFRENSLVFDFTKNLVVPINSVTTRVKIDLVGFYNIAQGLILPGSVTDDESRVTDYSAWYSFETGRFRYSEVKIG